MFTSFSYFNNLVLLKKPHYCSRNRKKQFRRVSLYMMFLFSSDFNNSLNYRYLRRNLTVSGRYLCRQRNYTFYRTSFKYRLNVLQRCFTRFKFPFVSFMGKSPSHCLKDILDCLNILIWKISCSAYWPGIGV